ncbi:hypothetical protein Ccrd_008363, partial [Cynara cardunculus var. scolymus]
MATTILINGFHSEGDVMAKYVRNIFHKPFCNVVLYTTHMSICRKQIKGFAKFRLVSCGQSFSGFSYGKGECGFAQFPTFRLEAYDNIFYFDFSMTYVGTGMICLHISFSLLFGVVMSWGIMGPLIEKQKREWFPSNVPESSTKNLNGYK